MPYLSFVEGVPAVANLQVVKPVTVYEINKNNWQKIEKENPELRELFKTMTINTMYKFIYYIYDLHCYENKERLELAYKRMPYLKDVKDDEIGEYIGTNRTTINRIKNIIKKQK